MTRVVIIGGGIAGLAAARVLQGRRAVEVTLIDRKPTSDFLPLLPDVAAGRLDASLARAPLPELAVRYRFKYVQGRVQHVEAPQRYVGLESGKVPYDYLLVASGAEPNFYGNVQATQSAFPLHTAIDAVRIEEALRTGLYRHFVIVGGSYTGIEIATHLRCRLNAAHRTGRIVVVEKTPAIVGSLPPWMRDYVRANLATLGIECLESCEVTTLGPTNVVLSDGTTFHDTMTLWVAGVRTADFTRTLPADRNPQGRLVVDPALRIDDRIFVAGDAALVQHRGAPLRMSIQFALTQGTRSARNMLRALAGAPVRPYRPFDPGYVVPMANRRSCGRVAGVNLRGSFPTSLHYALCAYRSVGWARRWRVLRSARCALV